MRLFAATFILSIFLCTSALAMNGAQEQEQMTAQQVVVVPDNNNVLIAVAVVGALGTLGAAYITTRNRKG